MQESESVVCRLCGNQASIKFRGQPGYREPDVYDIVHCDNCQTAYALPLEIDEAVYDFIYKNRDRMPGYMRYVRYSKQALVEQGPLGYLEDAEDVYWAIGRYLDGLPKDAKILEVGCGLGYLTYGISKRGYDITGLDISQTAVDEATRKYGNLYSCADLFEYSRLNPEGFDLVIMTEVIEHLPDPVGFMEAAGRLLRPGGSIIITTPNRSVHHKTVLWQTESPPVHLWWFTEESLNWFARRLGLDVSFTDFTPYSRTHPIRRGCALSLCLPTRGPVLKADDSLVTEDEERTIIAGLQRNILKKSAFKLVNQFLKSRDMTAGGKRRGAICATFRRR